MDAPCNGRFVRNLLRQLPLLILMFAQRARPRCHIAGTEAHGAVFNLCGAVRGRVQYPHCY